MAENQMDVTNDATADSASQAQPVSSDGPELAQAPETAAHDVMQSQADSHQAQAPDPAPVSTGQPQAESSSNESNRPIKINKSSSGVETTEEFMDDSYYNDNDNEADDDIETDEEDESPPERTLFTGQLIDSVAQTEQILYFKLLKEIYDRIMTGVDDPAQDKACQAVWNKWSGLSKGSTKANQERNSSYSSTKGHNRIQGEPNLNAMAQIWINYRKDRSTRQVAEAGLKRLWIQQQFPKGWTRFPPQNKGARPTKQDLKSDYMDTWHWDPDLDVPVEPRAETEPAQEFTPIDSSTAGYESLSKNSTKIPIFAVSNPATAGQWKINQTHDGDRIVAVDKKYQKKYDKDGAVFVTATWSYIVERVFNRQTARSIIPEELCGGRTLRPYIRNMPEVKTKVEDIKELQAKNIISGKWGINWTALRLTSEIKTSALPHMIHEVWFAQQNNSQSVVHLWRGGLEAVVGKVLANKTVTKSLTPKGSHCQSLWDALCLQNPELIRIRKLVISKETPLQSRERGGHERQVQEPTLREEAERERAERKNYKLERLAAAMIAREDREKGVV